MTAKSMFGCYSYLAFLLLFLNGCTLWITDLQALKFSLSLRDPGQQSSQDVLELRGLLQLSGKVVQPNVEFLFQGLKAFIKVADGLLKLVLSWSGSCFSWSCLFALGHSSEVFCFSWWSFTERVGFSLQGGKLGLMVLDSLL